MVTHHVIHDQPRSGLPATLDAHLAPNTAHVLYHCTPHTVPPPTPEAIEVTYRHPDEITAWHGDHRAWAAKAMAWRGNQLPG